MNRVYFSQVDNRWKNHPYTSSKYPSATIGSGGCGATSGAMIVSSLVQTIYPNEMGDIFKANGLRASTGTSPEAFPWIARKYGLKMKQSNYIADAVECLKRGGMCVAYLNAKSLFADGGHIVVLADMKSENEIVVYDPYLYANKFNIVYNGIDRRNKVKLNGVEAIISVENFKKYNNYTLYCYEPTYTKQPSKYQEGSAIEIKVPVAFTGSKAGNLQVGGMDLQVDDMRRTDESQYWIHESVVKNSVIHARATISFASGKAYMVQVFNRQFWITESNIVKKL